MYIIDYILNMNKSIVPFLIHLILKSTDGFGVASSYSVVEVYADAQIWKVA